MSQVTAIIGLGNPGAEYDATRHNAGFWLVEAIAQSAHAELRPEKKFFGHYAKVRLGDHELHLLNPATFMNRSGAAVAAYWSPTTNSTSPLDRHATKPAAGTAATTACAILSAH